MMMMNNEKLEFGNPKHIQWRDKLAADARKAERFAKAAELLGMARHELEARISPGDAIQGLESYIRGVDNLGGGGFLDDAIDSLRMDCGTLRRLTRNQSAVLEAELKNIRDNVENYLADTLGEIRPIRWRC